ncbi:MAG: ankyrin repeat domain-containing protein [Vicinamibacterales bacterium]
MAITAGAAAAQDSALGTFTVSGKTIRLTSVYATMETSPLDASQKYLILLLTDSPLAVPDRSPDRLTELAKSGSLHAVKLRWRYGADDIAVVPYHAAIAESGRAFASMSTVNLSALDEKRVNAEFKSKMLGQTWFFNAIVKAAIVTGGLATLEPDAEAAPATAVSGAGRSDATSLKRALGGMGYEFTPDALFHAIADRKAAAVTLFLQAGMSPNQKNDRNTYALNHAVLFCAQSRAESAAVITALLAGKADVKTKDPANGTTALVGAVQSCSADAVAALVKAGSDLSAKSNGGMTALQLARIFSRPEVVEVLEKAGAK